MIVDASGQQADLGDHEEAAAAGVAEVLSRHTTRFEWDAARAGIDLLVKNDLETGPNRARLKIFSPRPGTVVLFVYKDSQVPFSTDRFTYGALVSKSPAFPADDIEKLIAWLVSGLHPELRPLSVRRAFPFDVP